MVLFRLLQVELQESQGATLRFLDLICPMYFRGVLSVASDRSKEWSFLFIRGPSHSRAPEFPVSSSEITRCLVAAVPDTRNVWHPSVQRWKTYTRANGGSE